MPSSKVLPDSDDTPVDYELHEGDRVWLPEIGLAIGIERGTYLGIPRQWLYWYDEPGKRFLTPEEQMKQARQEAQQA